MLRYFRANLFRSSLALCLVAAPADVFAGSLQAQPPVRGPVESKPANAPAAPTSPADNNGPFQTMCVRSCDGFYFPIRQNAMRESFAGDAAACNSACGVKARLFYFPLYTGRPATMIDLEGHRYADEPSAFLFRKAIVPGCSCKPEPWSEAAAARHKAYARAAAATAAKERALAKARAEAEAQRASAAISAEAAREYYFGEKAEPAIPVRHDAALPDETIAPDQHAEADLPPVRTAPARPLFLHQPRW